MASEASSSNSLNGSWVNLNPPFISTAVRTATVNSYAMERLLKEAQRDSSLTSSHVASLASSRVMSPRSSPCTPNSELAADSSQSDMAPTSIHESDYLEIIGNESNDWVWNWSSRPEAVPPSDYMNRVKHPTTKWKKLSIRNTRVMDAIIFSIEHLPILLFTHACTFVFGAATMLIILKKCCNWSAVATPTVDG